MQNYFTRFLLMPWPQQSFPSLLVLVLVKCLERSMDIRFRRTRSYLVRQRYKEDILGIQGSGEPGATWSGREIRRKYYQRYKENKELLVRQRYKEDILGIQGEPGATWSGRDLRRIYLGYKVQENQELLGQVEKLG